MTERDALIIKNMPLAKKIASGYLFNEDIVQQGMLGLIYAVDSYVPGGPPLSTYIAKCVRWSINKYLDKDMHDGVKHRARQIVSYMRTHPENTVEDIAKHFGETVQWVNDKLQAASYSTMSMQQPLSNSSSKEMYTAERLITYEDDEDVLDVVCRNNISEIVRKKVESIPYKPRYVICSIFGICGHKQMSVAEIAENLGCTRQNVYLLKSEACRRLRSKLSYLMEDAHENV